MLLLAASYLFYSWWDWRFTLILFGTSCVDYHCAGRIRKTDDEKIRKRFLVISVTTNLTNLGFFKYFNFFADSAVGVLTAFGFSPDPVTLNIVLPIGVSFYTFQEISHIVDVHRGHLKPSKRLPEYLLFVSFPPPTRRRPDPAGHASAAAGPESPLSDKRGLPEGRVAGTGGLFQEGGHCGQPGGHRGHGVQRSGELPRSGGAVRRLRVRATDLWRFLGLFRYCPRRGPALGLRPNSKLPHAIFRAEPPGVLAPLAHQPVDLASRLSVHFAWRQREGPLGTYKNLFLTMLLGGLWHGAAWNFVFWGGYQGLLLIVHRLFVGKADPAQNTGRAWVRVLKI